MKTQTAIQTFLQSRRAKNLKPTTIQWYEAQLTKFASFYPELPLEPAPLEEFLMHISGTPETRHGYYRTLKALYRFIARRCRCPNAIEFVDAPRCPKKFMPTLEPHEMMHLLELARNFRDRVLLTLFIDTGARASELAGLRKEDIQPNSIIVRGKTGVREIPISDETKRLLLNLISTDGKSEYVFTGSQGRPLTRYGIYILIRKLMRKAGISTPKHGPHRIRHGFGKGYLVNGGDIRSLQQIMGHSNISTTEKYASLNLNDLQIKHHRFTPLRAAHAAAQESLFDSNPVIKEAEAILAGREI